MSEITIISIDASEIEGAFNAAAHTPPFAGANQLKNQLEADILELLEDNGFTPVE
jgi:hypothetical protein